MRRFEEIYEFGVKAIQRNMDQKHFGYDLSTLLQDKDHKEWTDKKKTELFIGTAVKWREMMEKHGTNEEDECAKTGNCSTAHRILFIMDLFNKHFLKQIVYQKKNEKEETSHYLDLFTQCLNGYNAVSLLNDYNHIRIKHSWAANERLRDCKDPGMYTDCSRSLRTLRERTSAAKGTGNDSQNSLYRKFKNGLSDRQHVLLEISLKLHSFLNHTESEQAEQKEEEMMNDENEPLVGDVIANKFVNEVEDGTVVDEKVTKMDGFLSAVDRFGASNNQFIATQTWMDKEQFDTDSIECDLETATEALKTERILKDEDVIDSNLSLILQNNRYRIMKHMVFHLEELGSFKFGEVPFRHWKRFENASVFVKHRKYNNLKEECLNNSIHSISIRVFNQIMIKSLMHQMSNEGRKMMAFDDGSMNKDFEIPANSPVSVAHIMVVIMYTDLDDLQREYKKKACRESTAFRTYADFQELKDRHSEISWWYKLLFESVEFWGSRTTPTDVFFTGLNCRLVFDSVTQSFLCPISTTTSESVAYRFSKGKGLILKMKPTVGSTDKYMDVEWLSAFGEQEKERLFVRALELLIVDIQSFGDGKRKRIANCINCFVLFLSLFDAHYIGHILKGRKAKTERILLSLIRQYKWDHLVESKDIEKVEAPKFSFFVEQLFLNLLAKFAKKDEKRVYIIPSEYQLLSEELRDELVFSSDEVVQGQHEVMVSPFLMTLARTPKDIVLMEEYIWSMDEDKVNEFKRLKSGHNMYCRENFMCKVWDSSTGKVRNSDGFFFNILLRRQPSDSESMEIGFKIRESTIPYVAGRCSWDIPDVGFCKSGSAFGPLRIDDEVVSLHFNVEKLRNVKVMSIRLALYARQYFTKEQLEMLNDRTNEM